MGLSGNGGSRSGPSTAFLMARATVKSQLHKHTPPPPPDCRLCQDTQGCLAATLTFLAKQTWSKLKEPSQRGARKEQTCTGEQVSHEIICRREGRPSEGVLPAP